MCLRYWVWINLNVYKFIVATILVIDDEKKQCDLLQDMLFREGYGVVAQLSATKILSLMDKVRPDLLIVDIFMPVKDGLEAILEVRKAGFKLPIIAVSESFRNDMNFLDIATDLGADCTFEKPLNKLTLLEAIHRLLPAENMVAGLPPVSVQMAGGHNSQD